VSQLPELELRGRVAPWRRLEWLLLAVLIVFGFWLRVRGLSELGFADDELHKWMAANRYVHGDFTGDDVEHPMLMKWLIALCLKIGARFGWAPESIVRVPNVLAGTVSIWVVAQLGRRAFGKLPGLWAAGLAAFSTTFIGYQRIAKEDTLLGLFLMLLLWCCAEAKAAADDGDTRAQHRWEYLGAASLGAMLASKYFVFFTPIPVVFYLSVRRLSRWRIPVRRWLWLTAVSFVIFSIINWTPFLPSSWSYWGAYVNGKTGPVHGSLLFMGEVFHNLPPYWLAGTPAWFYVVFAAVKLSPLTVLTAIGGLVLALWQRRPAHRLILSWMGVWFLLLSISGSKWGRFFSSVLPAFLLLSGYFSAQLFAWWSSRRISASPSRSVAGAVGARSPAVLVLALVTLALWGGEAQASLRYAPHYRLYINWLGGGDRNVDWFFPHCDYFDAGFRESVAYVAAHAEPNAELSTEIDWLARYYAEQFGRSDLTYTLVRQGESCRQGRTCYVIVQAGRLYFLNREAVNNLERLTPWHVESIRGHPAAKVYRLSAGESPFPDESLASTRASPQAQ